MQQVSPAVVPLLDLPVLVLPSPRTPAWSGPPDPLPSPLILISLGLALQRTWDTDAHLVLYRDPTSSAGCRVKKSTPGVQDLTVGLTALDWDMPGHAPLDQTSWEALQSTIARYPDLTPTVLHSTRHGARLL